MSISISSCVPLPTRFPRLGLTFSLSVALLLLADCGPATGHRVSRTSQPGPAGSAPSSTAAPSRPPSARTTPAAQPPPAGADAGRLSDSQWAQRALQILDTVDSAVADYHAATTLSPYSLRHRQLQESAYAGFGRALSDNEALWPATQQVKDGATRDQFVFVLGNVGGFMHPTPDLPADPGGPTLGDRIGRSLQNAVSASAAVRPRLQRLATGH